MAIFCYLVRFLYFDMLRRILLIGLWACLLTGSEYRLFAQNRGVIRTWGKTFGTAQTDRDFLIYDATCSQTNPALFIVGKAENSSLEIKQNGNAYFHTKDENTDAFLACMSLDGELRWSTYLPSLENGYYNAFATTVEYTKDSTILVIGNAYQIQDNLEITKSLIPKCPGKLFVFEFDLTGTLLRSKSLSILFRIGKTLLPLYVPRIIKSTGNQEGNYTFGGISLSCIAMHDHDNSSSLFSYSDTFVADFSWQTDTIEVPFNSNISSNLVYSAAYALTFSEFNYILMMQSSNHLLSLTGNLYISPLKTAKAENNFYLFSRGMDLLKHSPLFEQWDIMTEEYYGAEESQKTFQHRGQPKGTHVENTDVNQSAHKRIFPGTVQNIHAYKDKYLIQGVHCHNYSNGFFKENGQDVPYSHDSIHLIPTPVSGFYQDRNNRFSTAPYLLVYDSTSLLRTQYPDMPISPTTQEAEDSFDFETPLWGSYLDADWFYEDIFHITDSTQWKDIYQPYEPVLCSYGNRIFLIGNVKTIDDKLIDNPAMNQDTIHHQGVVLAFAIFFEGDCPLENTVFQNVRFLCPDDSVELKLSADYDGFKFIFDSTVLADNSIVLNNDNSRAWAKREGTFSATLDGKALGCPDVAVDTVRISFSPYPEPERIPWPDDSMTICAMESVLLETVAIPDSFFSIRWLDGSSDHSRNVFFTGDSIFFTSVEVSSYCTSFRDSITIRFLPPYVNLGNDTLICADTVQIFSDSDVLLRLDAKQKHFPGLECIFKWRINGNEASVNDSLLLRYADLESIGKELKRAVITVEVSLSDAEANGCTAHDTLVFSLFSLSDISTNRFLPQREILCADQDLELHLTDTAGIYRCFWLDQDSVLLPYGYETNQFTITGMHGTDGFGANTDTRNPRFFQLRLDHKLCGVSFFDTLWVYDQIKPRLNLPFHDTLICFNEPVELDSLNLLVFRPFYAFEWSDGTKGSAYSFTNSGTYILNFFVNEDFAVCGYDTASDTLRVRWSDPALTLINMPSDTSFCEKLSVTLDASVPFPSTRYSWQEGNLDDLFSPLEDSTLFTDPVIKVDKEVSLALFVVDTMGCVNTQQIDVSEDDCKPSLSVPNVFTPNGDGVNDVLKFKQIDDCYDVDVLIVDRKGSRVLHQKLKNPEDFSWNGCMNNGGRKLPDGAYFYQISYKNAYGKKKYQSGSITILGSRE